MADIGAGGGYYALRFAEVVGTGGRVFAADMNPMFLEFIQAKAKEKGLSNIETVLTTKDSAALPRKGVDLIFMRNVCHHLAKRAKYFRGLKDALGTDGRIAIIEYRGGKRVSFHRLFGHYVPKERILKEMDEAGYQVENAFDFLPEQSFTVFHCQANSG